MRHYLFYVLNIDRIFAINDFKSICNFHNLHKEKTFNVPAYLSAGYVLYENSKNIKANRANEGFFLKKKVTLYPVNIQDDLVRGRTLYSRPYFNHPTAVQFQK